MKITVQFERIALALETISLSLIAITQQLKTLNEFKKGGQ